MCQKPSEILSHPKRRIVKLYCNGSDRSRRSDSWQVRQNRQGLGSVEATVTVEFGATVLDVKKNDTIQAYK